MARTLRDAEPAPPIEGAGVRQAEAEDAEAWAGVLQEGFFGGPAVGAAAIFEALFFAPGSAAYLAEHEGRPAAAAMMFATKAGALLACDATVPGCRGRGLQSALIQARLSRALRMGCGLAAACTAPGSVSQRNYERAGFRVVYTKAMLQKI
jgi:GNAT superfamily N-acetyltransferase